MSKPKPALPFVPGHQVVHTYHGVGTISAIETIEYEGISTEYYVMEIERTKLRLRVPTQGTNSSILRAVSPTSVLEPVLKILRQPAKKGMVRNWVQRAQTMSKYIHSGDILLVAEAISSLYRAPGEWRNLPEISLYQEALHHLTGELGVMLGKNVWDVTAYLEKKCPGKSFILSSFIQQSIRQPGAKKRYVSPFAKP